MSISININTYFINMRTTGFSMTPFIKSGARIILDKSSKQTYRIGDIVAYVDYKGKIVVHRIIRLILTSSGHTQYLFKGDYNSESDRYVDKQHLLWKVQKIVYPSYEIDLVTPLSSYIAQIIAYCGKITLAHHWFYTVERIIVFCLTLIIISCARWRPFCNTK